MRRPDDWRIEEVRGRFLVGRPDRAMIWARSEEELDHGLPTIVSALERDDDGQTLWELLLVLIRHDGGYVEQLIIIDPDTRTLDETALALCRECVLDTMFRVRECNRKIVKDDSAAAKPEEFQPR